MASVKWKPLPGAGCGNRKGITGADVRVGDDGSVVWEDGDKLRPYPFSVQADGTRSVRLAHGDLVKHVPVHRLVLLAWGRENRGTTQRVVWLDGDRRNCALANLEWANNIERPAAPSEMRLCAGCGLELPVKQFRANRRQPDGLSERCKECVRKKIGRGIEPIQPGVEAKLIPRYDDLEGDPCCACEDGSIWQRRDGEWVSVERKWDKGHGRLVSIVQKHGHPVQLHVADVVLRTFKSNRSLGWQVAHHDHNPWNCALSNLYWARVRSRD